MSAPGSPGSPLLTFILDHNHPSIPGPDATAGAPVTAELEFYIPSPCGGRRQTGLVKHPGKHQAWTLRPEWKQLPKQNHAKNFPAHEESLPALPVYPFVAWVLSQTVEDSKDLKPQIWTRPPLYKESRAEQDFTIYSPTPRARHLSRASVLGTASLLTLL